MAARVTGEPQTPGTLEYNQYHFMNALLEKFDIEPHVAAKAYILNRPYHFIQMMQENARSGSPQNYGNQDEIEARFLMCPDQKKIWSAIYKVLDNVQMIQPNIKTREDLEGSAEELKAYLEQNVRY